MSKKIQENAGDEVAVKSAKERDRLRKLRDDEDIRFLLNTKQGRRYIYRKICECGVFMPNTNTNSQIYVREGQRFVGLQMFEEAVAIEPEVFALMMREAREDEL